MGRPLTLEEFGAVRTRSAAGDPARTVTETDRLAAFEDGYRAGWDDAAAAQSDSENRIEADLAANLQDLSFTFHEARSHVLTAIEPLIGDLVSKVLPEIAKEAFPQLVSEMVVASARAATASAPVCIVTSPDSRTRIEAMLPAEPGFPLIVREEPTLTGGQAYIRTGEVEQSVDVDAALTELSRAVHDFFTLNNEKAKAHG